MTTAENVLTREHNHVGMSAAIGLILTGVALVLLFAVMPHTISADGSVRFVKLDALLREGTLRPDRFSYIGPLFAAPFWLLGQGRSILWWCARFNVLVLAAGCAAAWWALRPTTAAGDRAAFLLLLTAAGMIPNAVRDFYGELFSAVMIGSGLLIVTARQQRAGWIAVVLGVANAPASAAGLAIAAVVRLWKDRRVDALVALVASAGIIAMENILTRGSPFNAGYAGDKGYITLLPFSGMPGFSYPAILGLVSLLFSFGKGLFFFAPALLLVPIARRERPDLARFFDLSIAFVIGLLIVYSRWWAWYGGWTWGPRFLLFAAYPSALALAIALNPPRPERVERASPEPVEAAGVTRAVAIVVLIAWSVWVGVSGAVFDLAGLEACIENRYALEHLCWYVPEFSPLFRHLALPPSLVLSQKIWMVFAGVAAAVLITSGPALGRVAEGLAALTRSVYRG